MDEENKLAYRDELDSTLRLMAKTSFIVLIGLFLSKVLMYFYRISIARLPDGPEVYGLFSLSMLIFSLIIAIFSLGFSGGLVRYISFYRGKKEINKIRHTVKYAIILSLISGIIATILVLLFSEFISVRIFHNSDLIPYLFWFSLLIVPSILFSIFISIIQAYEKINWHSFIRNILDNVIKLSALWILIFLGLKSGAVIISYILGSLAIFFVSFYLCKYKLSEVFGRYYLNKKEKKEINKSLLYYSLPLVFLGIITFLFTSTDSFVIGILKNVESVGIYNAAVPLAALLFIAPNLFIQLFLPLITREFSNKNTKLIRDLSKQVAKWILILDLPILIIMILFPGAIINLFFGPQYISAENSLRFLAIGIFFYSIFLISENLISMTGKSKIILINIIITAIINLFLDIYLVKRYGITGAAIATMISYIILSFITALQAKKYTSIIPLKRKMILILLISLIPTIILIILKNFIPLNKITLIVQGIIFLLIYFLLMILTKCLDNNDWMIINSIKGKIFFNNKISDAHSRL